MIKTVVGTTTRKWKSKTSGNEVKARILYCLVEKENVRGRMCEEVMCFGNLVDDLEGIDVNKNYEFEYDIQGSKAFLRSVKLVK